MMNARRYLNRHIKRCVSALFLLLALSNALAAPRVSLPNGELTDSNTDLQVKVLGGSVSIARTWVNGR
jgi:hypothetical protein